MARAGRWLAAAIAVAIMECLVLQPRPARAQTTTCAELLLRYVGKPLANVLAEKGPAMVASYFTTRLEHSRQARVPDASANRVTLQDITNLKAIYRRNGRIDCDLRVDLDSSASFAKSESGPKYHRHQRTPPPAIPPATDVASAAPPPAPSPPSITPLSRPDTPTRTPATAEAARSDPSALPTPPAPILGPPRPSAPVTFSGGSVRKSTVTPLDPTPPAGFGLYVYILPERNADASILGALEEYHRCLDAPGAAEAAPTIALMILPVRDAESPRTDTALSHDLVRTAVPDDQIDDREVYLVAANAPLIRGIRVAPDAVKVILIGRIAPTFIGDWLARTQSLIEEGKLESPAALDLRLRSVLVEVNAIGSLIGIKPAEAAPYKCI